MSDFKAAVKNHRKYEENFQGILKLPVVLRLKRKNARLTKELRELEKKYQDLLEKFAGIRVVPPSKEPVKIKEEPKTEEIVVCDQAKENEDEEELEIVVCDQIKNNIQIVLEEVEEEDISEGQEDISEAEEDISEAVEEVEAEDISEAVEEGEEEEDTSEAVEEGEAEDTSEAEEAEVYEVTINKKTYYVTNETDSIIYDLDENGDISVEVGKYKNGKPVFTS